MAATLKLGNKIWATKEGSLLGYNNENGNYKPLPFDFTRASSATVVNKDGLIEVVTNNKPRIDFLNDSNGALLLEPQRQNVCLWSEQIDNAGWIKGNAPTITTNIATAPDGTVSADGIQSVTGGAFRNIKQVFSVSANSTATGSVFIKKETSETAFGGLGIIFTGSTSKNCYTIFNAVTGTGLIASSTLTGTIKVYDYGNYWRLEVTTTDNGSNTSITLSYESTISTNGTTVGNGAGSVRTIWGFQLEIGAAYPTSYIPTQGSAVTRIVDTCSQTPPAGVIGQTEGTILLEIPQLIAQPLGTFGAILSLYTSGSDRIGFICTNSTKISIYIISGGVTYLDFTFTPSNGVNKMALGYANNDAVVVVNGTVLTTDTSIVVPPSSAIALNTYGFSAFSANTSINQVQLFNTRLSNEELAALTTI